MQRRRSRHAGPNAPGEGLDIARAIVARMGRDAQRLDRAPARQSAVGNADAPERAQLITETRHMVEIGRAHPFLKRREWHILVE